MNLVQHALLYLSNFSMIFGIISKKYNSVDYLDRIRTRAGIPGIRTSWSARTLDQATMRQIVCQERIIELFLENHRFWDVRRWLLGTKDFNVQAQGMNINGTNDADFFHITTINFQRRFDLKNYLLPVPIDEISKNTKIVPNPGY